MRSWERTVRDVEQLLGRRRPGRPGLLRAVAALAATALALLAAGCGGDDEPAAPGSDLPRAGDEGMRFGYSEAFLAGTGEIAQLGRSGSDLARRRLSWTEIEPTQGAFDWSRYDALYAELIDEGIRPIGCSSTLPAGPGLRISPASPTRRRGPRASITPTTSAPSSPRRRAATPRRSGSRWATKSTTSASGSAGSTRTTTHTSSASPPTRSTRPIRKCRWWQAASLRSRRRAPTGCLGRTTCGRSSTPAPPRRSTRSPFTPIRPATPCRRPMPWSPSRRPSRRTSRRGDSVTCRSG